MNRTVFVDAAYAIALASPTDAHHAVALILADEVKRTRTLTVTTEAVLLEIGSSFSRQRHRATGMVLLKLLRAEPSVEVVLPTSDHYAAAFRLYCERPDKEWGMTDCVSFMVMRERGLQEALTTDEHFRQAGFHTLM